MGFMETSAKETVNVDECFTSLVSNILDQLQIEETKGQKEKLNLAQPTKPVKKKRCTLKRLLLCTYTEQFSCATSRTAKSKHRTI